jgi:hypothetical protein
LSEVQLFPGVHMRTTGNTDMPPNSFDIQQVILWDIGPSKPVAPKRPVMPKVFKEKKEGDPEYDLAKIEMADQLEEYAEALKRWKQEKIDFADWHKRNDGPVEIAFWSCDAADALARDGANAPISNIKVLDEHGQVVLDDQGNEKEEEVKHLRYFISARTRGYGRLPNRGLPPTAPPPGKGQAELERRAREGDADLVAARAADPVFGQQEIRP